MLYRELVEFDPIETVIRLREANQRDRARQLVQTYVISERMADRLANLVIPQLDLDRPRDNKGVLIVGNYGTGKSHLMAVLAALAEFPDLTGAVTDPQVAAAAGVIAGRFKVVRVEVGAVERSLRDILLDELQKALETWGTPYRFPPASQVGNNKDLIIAAVAAFQRTYPGMGILLVVDELLDYLRSREERQLILDLGFLRELGEVSSETAFRFIGGLQETLFDSPRFAFVAGQLRRVRDRFEQILIAREDIAYVISHRLLKKNDAQLAWIRDHLRRFEPLYAGLSERMGEFAALYPIHPAYIETFQDMFIAEKRQALVTFSQAMAARLDEPVPADEPGTISFDHYWGVLRDDPSLRSVPDVAKVIDASRTLEGLVRSSYTRPHLLPMAQRIIHALSVHRLTTDDIRAPVGLTAEALRDRLFLYGRTPQRTADSLLMEVQVALREIHRTVSGQFMLHSEENGQYWLDPYIIVNVPAQIEQRSEMLGADERNRYFYDALRQVLGLSTSTYVTNFRIWFYELPWTARRVTRPGYLFFGLPSERSTAQPPRDFYVYILPPFGSQNWQDEERPDEVILRLAGVGDDFTRKVALYAGARDLSMTSVDLRQEYAQHAETHLRELAFWLRENLVQHLQVTFEGVTRPAREVLAESRSSASESVRDVLDIVAARCLEPTFEDRYPDYPAFTRATANITEEARENTATQAVRAIAGYRRTQLVEAVWDGLRLLDDRGAIRPYDSPYARHLLGLLEAKPEGQVVNRGEVIERVAGEVDRAIEKDCRYRLEPDWVAVVMAALIYSGDIEVAYGAKRVSAGNIADLITMAMADLTDFRHYGKTPAPPIGRWADIYETLGVPPGLVRDENAREQGVRELHQTVGAELVRIAGLEHRVSQGPRLWNVPLFTDSLAIQVQDGLVVGSEHAAVPFGQLDVLPHLRAYKKLLEGLQPYDTVGKLRNLRILPEAVEDGRQGREVARRMEQLMSLVDELQERTAYLASAAPNLPADDPLQSGLAAARDELLRDLRRMGRGDQPIMPGRWPARLEELKRRYVERYAALHRRMVLGPADDERREALYHGDALRLLQELDQLHFLPSNDLRSWGRMLTELKTCRPFHEGLLDSEPTCPYCHLSPATMPGAADAAAALRALEESLETMLADWQRAVASALGSDTAQRSLAAMTPTERATIEAFLADPQAMALPAGFVDAANKALQGIESLPLSLAALEAALREGGLPCTVSDLRGRFNRFLLDAMRGHDEANTRLTIES